jgi:hypothetical protein
VFCVIAGLFLYIVLALPVVSFYAVEIEREYWLIVCFHGVNYFPWGSGGGVIITCCTIKLTMYCWFVDDIYFFGWIWPVLLLFTFSGLRWRFCLSVVPIVVCPSSQCVLYCVCSIVVGCITGLGLRGSLSLPSPVWSCWTFFFFVIYTGWMVVTVGVFVIVYMNMSKE